jgi:hypothetical protein
MLNPRQVNNMVAVHHATRMVQQQSHQVAQQNMLRQQMMNRQLLLQVVQQVVETPASLQELQGLAETFQQVQEQGLEPAQVALEIERSPFNWLLQLLPENKDQAYQFISMVVTIVTAVITILLTQRTPEPTQTITPEQVEQIIERVIERVEQEPPPGPPPSTAKDRK